MQIDAKRSVREILVELPHSATVFDKLGIDHNKHANSSLWQACTCAGVAIGDLINLLKKAEEPVKSAEKQPPIDRPRSISMI